MFRMIREKYQIFNSIIQSIPIYMMYSFVLIQYPTDMLFHYPPMFHNISKFARGFMKTLQNKFVAVRVNIKMWSLFGWFTKIDFSSVLNAESMTIIFMSITSIPALSRTVWFIFFAVFELFIAGFTYMIIHSVSIIIYRLVSVNKQVIEQCFKLMEEL